VTYVRDNGLGTVEPTLAAERAYVDDVQRMSKGTVWTAGGCQNWYVNKNGHNANIWPSSTLDFRRRTGRFNPTDHLVHRPTPARELVGA